MESILTSIKKMLGIVEEYEHFDADLIIHINSVMAILTQIGVGPSKGFSIKDATATWSDFVGEEPRIEFIKSYVYLKVKLLFDPSLNSGVTEATDRMISELEWRILVAADPVENESEEENQNE